MDNDNPLTDATQTLRLPWLSLRWIMLRSRRAFMWTKDALMNQLFGAAWWRPQSRRRGGPGPGIYLKAYQKFHQYKPGTNIKRLALPDPHQHSYHQRRKAQRSPGALPATVVEDWAASATQLAPEVWPSIAKSRSSERCSSFALR